MKKHPIKSHTGEDYRRSETLYDSQPVIKRTQNYMDVQTLYRYIMVYVYVVVLDVTGTQHVNSSLDYTAKMLPSAFYLCGVIQWIQPTHVDPYHINDKSIHLSYGTNTHAQKPAYVNMRHLSMEIKMNQ